MKTSSARLLLIILAVACLTPGNAQPPANEPPARPPYWAKAEMFGQKCQHRCGYNHTWLWRFKLRARYYSESYAAEDVYAFIEGPGVRPLRLDAAEWGDWSKIGYQDEDLPRHIWWQAEQEITWNGWCPTHQHWVESDWWKRLEAYWGSSTLQFVVCRRSDDAELCRTPIVWTTKSYDDSATGRCRSTEGHGGSD